MHKVKIIQASTTVELERLTNEFLKELFDNECDVIHVFFTHSRNSDSLYTSYIRYKIF